MPGEEVEEAKQEEEELREEDRRTWCKVSSRTNVLSYNGATCQGRALVHFSAQLKRLLWDRGAFEGCLGGIQEVSGGIRGYQGVFMGFFVS